MQEFLTDVTTLRANARENIEKGSVTDAYGADLERVLYVLNQTLATELVCVLRYKRHFFTARGINAHAAADEFLQHAGDDSSQLEAMIREDLIAERVAIASYTEIISWLGEGDPTTRRMLEEILAVEEEHAEDMLDLLDALE